MLRQTHTLGSRTLGFSTTLTTGRMTAGNSCPYLCPCSRVENDICLCGQLRETFSPRFFYLDADLCLGVDSAQETDAVQSSVWYSTLHQAGMRNLIVAD